MTEKNINTAYDDVFKTLLVDCPRLIIPIVNEVFGEHYKGDEKVTFGNNEHFLQQQGGKEEKRISDSNFVIHGINCKQYHFECQSTVDGRIVVRMIEYDMQIALENSELTEDTLTIVLPYSAILYLRHNKNTPDKMRIRLRTPNGEMSYQVHALKMKYYKIEELFDRKLFLLIPFYIFVYESEFAKMEMQDSRLSELANNYREIWERLEDLCKNGEMNEYEKCTIIDMSKKVLTQIAKNDKKVRERIGSVMGGKVLEYEAKTILNKGRQEGREECYKILAGLVNDGILTIEEAAKRADIKVEELQKYL